MALPTTLADLKTYVTNADGWPVDKTTATFYGLSDRETPNAYVSFGNLKTVPAYTTCGVHRYDSAFTVDVLSTSNAAALTLAGQVDALLTGQAVTPKTMLCSLENFEVVQDDKYRFHVLLNYSLQESA